MKSISGLLFFFAIAAFPGLSTQAQAGSANDALDCVLKAVYTIEKRDIHLISGRAVVPVAPGSAINITTTVFGEPVYLRVSGSRNWPSTRTWKKF